MNNYKEVVPVDLLERVGSIVPKMEDLGVVNNGGTNNNGSSSSNNLKKHNKSHINITRLLTEIIVDLLGFIDRIILSYLYNFTCRFNQCRRCSDMVQLIFFNYDCPMTVIVS